jgi:4-hydroxybenzoate polyprenyltransferase and related prenyltransferases
MKNHIQSTTVPVFSRAFLRYYAITMRPYLLFVSGATGIAGIAFSPVTSTAQLWMVIAASFLSYGFGQALTDCFQIDTDTRSSPYRPLTRGLVSRFQIGSISILGLLCCAYIFSHYNPLNMGLGILAGIGLATYTPFKRMWWSGPFYNAWIVGVLCIMTFLAGGGMLSEIMGVPTIFIVLTTFFGYANFVLSGYFKDIEADRSTGYRTLPVVYGRGIAAIASDVLALLFIVSAVLTFVFTGKGFVQFLFPSSFLLIGICIAIIGQIRLHRVQTDKDAHRAIAPVVYSYILVLAGLSTMRQPAWIIPLIIFYGLYVLVMQLRPAQDQI